MSKTLSGTINFDAWRWSIDPSIRQLSMYERGALIEILLAMRGQPYTDAELLDESGIHPESFPSTVGQLLELGLLTRNDNQYLVDNCGFFTGWRS